MKKINLGCGQIYKKGYVNIDNNPKNKIDLNSTFQNFHTHFKNNSIDLILGSHIIGYLYKHELKEMLINSYKILNNNGKIILEFPDIIKCSLLIVFGNKKYSQIGVMGVYAFDSNQLKSKDHYFPYVYGWSSKEVKLILKEIGYKNIKVKLPKLHGKRFWRDSRIEAEK